MIVPRLAGLALAAALVVGATGCVSSEQQSAQIARQVRADVKASDGTVHLTAGNGGVRVLHSTIVSAGGRTAAALELVNAAGAVQVNVPLQIDVTASDGHSLYRNNMQGLEPSLQQIAAVAPGQHVWWVDDQVLTSTPASAVKAQVGKAVARAGAKLPAITVTGLQVGHLNWLAYLAGNVVNRSGVAQTQRPVFAVGLRGGRVVAAGRALVPSLPAGPHGAPQSFRIFLVGNPAGAKFQVTVAATRL